MISQSVSVLRYLQCWRTSWAPCWLVIRSSARAPPTCWSTRSCCRPAHRAAWCRWWSSTANACRSAKHVKHMWDTPKNTGKPRRLCDLEKHELSFSLVAKGAAAFSSQSHTSSSVSSARAPVPNQVGEIWGESWGHKLWSPAAEQLVDLETADVTCEHTSHLRAGSDQRTFTGKFMFYTTWILFWQFFLSFPFTWNKQTDQPVKHLCCFPVDVWTPAVFNRF